MTLALFLTQPGELAHVSVGTTYVLAGPEGRHAATVKRVRPGERLYVADGAGRRLTGTVAAAEASQVRLAVEDVLDEPPPAVTITLAQALAKADRDEAAIEMATEFGVDRIIPWQADRSIVRWRGDRAAKSRQRWVETVRAAVKQSRRAWVPPLEDLVDSAALARRAERAAACFVLHEQATHALAGQPMPQVGEVLLIVGPEGGISDEEVRRFEAAGGLPVRLGATVLRASGAGPAAIAVLSARQRWR